MRWTVEKNNWMLMEGMQCRRVYGSEVWSSLEGWRGAWVDGRAWERYEESGRRLAGEELRTDEEEGDA